MVATKPRKQVKKAPVPTGKKTTKPRNQKKEVPVPAGKKATIGSVNKKLLAAKLQVAKVRISDCDLLEKNARFMQVEQYRRLVDNIRRDGCLTSIPFAVKQKGRYTILSGNHRIKAAKDAGLEEVMLLYTEQKLNRAQQVAIQLSHNAIAGQDDMAILRELYDEINNVAWMEYSGLDDVLLGKMIPPELDPLSEKGLEYRIVSIMFLPEEVKRAEKLFQKVLELATGHKTWVNRRAEYDRLLDALTFAKAKAGVKNTATALGLMLDVVENHLDEIPEKKKSTTKKE